jgi:uncharacterized sulfatase
MIDLLERSGELENTLIVVTSDNGMSFPGAKATMHEYGIHMPLAVCWAARVKGGRTVDDLVSHTDWAPTFLEAAGVRAPAETTGRSLMNVLTSTRSGHVDPKRTFSLSGRERHSHARADNLGYPARALRTSQYLYTRNFKPDRWPAGDPPGYYDIDAGPSKTYMLEHRSSPFFEAAYGKQPAEALFDIREDPGCLKNLANTREAVRKQLGKQLEDILRAQSDPRVTGRGDVWESYPRHSPMRPELGGFAERGKYNPKYQ